MLLSGERIDQLYADDIQIIQSKEVLFPLMQSYWLIFRNYQKGKIVDLCVAMVGLFVSRKTGKDRPNRITTSFGRYGSTKYSIK